MQASQFPNLAKIMLICPATPVWLVYYGSRGYLQSGSRVIGRRAMRVMAPTSPAGERVYREANPAASVRTPAPRVPGGPNWRRLERRGAGVTVSRTLNGPDVYPRPARATCDQLPAASRARSGNAYWRAGHTRA